ncbi:MAG TPA: hypothetical protein VEJ20_06585 [Candidatus Eremiobacteraceae bacterium]|nr:hypothetical protein [Candidatus Eremiobacteraceae bacterium]
MATATQKETIPFIPSSAKGPLGAAHLPRLWTKLSLGNAGALAEGWDYCGGGFDEMTINNLGLNKQKTLDYVKTHKPTYVQFEEWVVQNGKTDPETIRKHNESIHGYHHGDEKVKHMAHTMGLKHAHVKDAVTLNMLDDLHELHGRLN